MAALLKYGLTLRWNAMNTLITRLARIASQLFQRATTGASDGLEDYLSSAKTLHQLEDMQRQWDRAHRNPHHRGAY